MGFKHPLLLTPFVAKLLEGCVEVDVGGVMAVMYHLDLLKTLLHSICHDHLMTREMHAYTQLVNLFFPCQTFVEQGYTEDEIRMAIQSENSFCPTLSLTECQRQVTLSGCQELLDWRRVSTRRTRAYEANIACEARKYNRCGWVR